MISTMRPAPRRSRTSRRSKSNIWGIEMPRPSALLFAITGSAMAAPVTRFVPDSVSRAINTVDRPDESRVILVQRGGRGGGGGRAAGGRGGGGANRSGNFNSNNFHRDVANNSSRRTNVNASNRSATANRSANVNASRNVNVYGGGGGAMAATTPPDLAGVASRRVSRSVPWLVLPRIQPIRRLRRHIHPATSRRHHIRRSTRLEVGL